MEEKDPESESSRVLRVADFLLPAVELPGYVLAASTFINTGKPNLRNIRTEVFGCWLFSRNDLYSNTAWAEHWGQQRRKSLDKADKNSVRSVPAPRWVIDEILVRRVWYEKQKQHVPDFFDQGDICCHSDGSPYHRSQFRILWALFPRIHRGGLCISGRKIYDCSVLCEIWEISRPPNEKNELLVPLSDSDYYALLA